jgi:uncharacterized protein YciI
MATRSDGGSWFIAMAHNDADGELDLLRRSHLEYLRDELRSGTVFAAGRADDLRIRILHAASLAEARRMLDADPYVRRGGLKYDIRRWSVSDETAAGLCAGIAAGLAGRLDELDEMLEDGGDRDR